MLRVSSSYMEKHAYKSEQEFDSMNEQVAR